MQTQVKNLDISCEQGKEDLCLDVVREGKIFWFYSMRLIDTCATNTRAVKRNALKHHQVGDFHLHPESLWEVDALQSKKGFISRRYYLRAAGDQVR